MASQQRNAEVPPALDPDGRDQHAGIIAGVMAQLAPVLQGSPQGIYVYLDDTHKGCNQRFAELLGYASAADWDRPASFTEQYVDRSSQRTLVATYQHAMQHQVAASIDVTWVRADGTRVPTSVILVPIAFEGELLALHFVTPR